MEKVRTGGVVYGVKNGIISKGTLAFADNGCALIEVERKGNIRLPFFRSNITHVLDTAFKKADEQLGIDIDKFNLYYVDEFEMGVCTVVSYMEHFIEVKDIYGRNRTFEFNQVNDKRTELIAQLCGYH